MSNYDRRQPPRQGAQRPTSQGREGAARRQGQRPGVDARRQPRPAPNRASRYRDEYYGNTRRNGPVRGHERKRRSGCLATLLLLFTFLIGVFFGIYAVVRYDVLSYMPETIRATLNKESIVLTPLVTPTALPEATEEPFAAEDVDDLMDLFRDVLPAEDDAEGWEEEMTEETPEPVQATPEPQVQPTPAPAAQEKVYVSYKNGDRDDEIIGIQEKLKELNYLDDTADGIFGGKTETALKAYQQAEGLEQTGIADEATQKALFGIVDEPEMEVTPEPAAQEQTAEASEPVSITNIALSFGERAEIANYCAITLNQYRFDYDVWPSVEDEDVIQNFFSTDTAETTFLYIDGEIENMSEGPIGAKDFTCSIYTNTQDYPGLVGLEYDDGTQLSNEALLEPGEKTRIVLLIEVPTGMKDSEEPIVALLGAKDTIYQITVR